MRSTLRAFAFALALSASAWGAESPAPSPYDDAIMRGREAAQKGMMGNALEFFEKAEKIEPRRLHAHYFRGETLSRLHKGDEAIAAFTKVIEIDPKASTAYNLRGFERFKLGQIEKSLEDFDKYLQLEPQQGPFHWQRGIALYYAGRYDEGRKQFERHQTVNSDDVENAVWHFACVARAENFDKARAALIPIQGDRRVPMMEIQRLFAGTGTEDEVMKAVKGGEPSPVELDARNFRAHQYLGLYYEAKGDAKQAFEHTKLAGTTYAADQYMGDVAKVHFKRLLEKPRK